MITTFLYDCELNQLTSSEIVNELIAEVRKQTSENWQVLEIFVEPKSRWWSLRKSAPKVQKVYQLFKYCGGMGPWQQINFYGEMSDSSINTSVNADVIIAYMYGILAGVHSKEMKNVKAD